MTYLMKTLNKGTIEISLDNQNCFFGDYSISIKNFFVSLYKLAKMENNFEVHLKDGNKIPIKWDEKEKNFEIGDYTMEGEEIEAVSKHFFMGGYFDWNPDNPSFKPDFVKKPLKSIEEIVKRNDSINPYLKEIPSFVKYIDKVREKINKKYLKNN